MIIPALRSYIKDRRYRYLTFSTIAIVLVGMFGFKYIEGWRWIDALSYSVSIMVTTGNSDVYPVTDGGKIFNIIYMFLSVILILLFVNTLHQHFHESRLSREVKHKRHQKIVEKQIEVQKED